MPRYRTRRAARTLKRVPARAGTRSADLAGHPGPVGPPVPPGAQNRVSGRRADRCRSTAQWRELRVVHTDGSFSDPVRARDLDGLDAGSVLVGTDDTGRLVALVRDGDRLVPAGGPTVTVRAGVRQVLGHWSSTGVDLGVHRAVVTAVLGVTQQSWTDTPSRDRFVALVLAAITPQVRPTTAQVAELAEEAHRLWLLTTYGVDGFDVPDTTDIGEPGPLVALTRFVTALPATLYPGPALVRMLETVPGFDLVAKHVGADPADPGFADRLRTRLLETATGIDKADGSNILTAVLIRIGHPDIWPVIDTTWEPGGTSRSGTHLDRANIALLLAPVYQTVLSAHLHQYTRPTVLPGRLRPGIRDPETGEFTDDPLEFVTSTEHALAPHRVLTGYDLTRILARDLLSRWVTDLPRPGIAVPTGQETAVDRMIVEGLGSLYGVLKIPPRGVGDSDPDPAQIRGLFAPLTLHRPDLAPGRDPARRAVIHRVLDPLAGDRIPVLADHLGPVGHPDPVAAHRVWHAVSGTSRCLPEVEAHIPVGRITLDPSGGWGPAPSGSSPGDPDPLERYRGSRVNPWAWDLDRDTHPWLRRLSEGTPLAATADKPLAVSARAETLSRLTDLVVTGSRNHVRVRPYTALDPETLDRIEATCPGGWEGMARYLTTRRAVPWESMSSGEAALYGVLVSLWGARNVAVIREHPVPGDPQRRFDLWVDTDPPVVVEFDGIQHFRPCPHFDRRTRSTLTSRRASDGLKAGLLAHDRPGATLVAVHTHALGGARDPRAVEAVGPVLDRLGDPGRGGEPVDGLRWFVVLPAHAAGDLVDPGTGVVHYDPDWVREPPHPGPAGPPGAESGGAPRPRLVVHHDNPEPGLFLVLRFAGWETGA